MGPVVVDASLTLSWCFADEVTSYTRSILQLLESTHAVVPAHWIFEVANALAIAERKRRITAEGIDAFLARLQRLPIYIDRREPQLIWQAVLPVARECGLTAYDAAYVELARRDGLALATLDEELRAACGKVGVVLA
jgi:predicted nucleic acid-binding protein